jgi:predicted heme/steroid binding protein
MLANSSVHDKQLERETDGSPSTPRRRYTPAELALHDGSDPIRPVLVAYKAKVYDVTASYPWSKAVPWGDHRAAQDLTTCLKEPVHGEEMLLRVPCVGILYAMRS